MLRDQAQPALPGLDTPSPVTRRARPCCPRCRRPLGKVAAQRRSAPVRDYDALWDAEIAAHPEDEIAIAACVRRLFAEAGRPIGMAKVWEALRGKVGANMDNSYRRPAGRRLIRLWPDLAGKITARDTAGDPTRAR